MPPTILTLADELIDDVRFWHKGARAGGGVRHDEYPDNQPRAQSF